MSTLFSIAEMAWHSIGIRDLCLIKFVTPRVNSAIYRPKTTQKPFFEGAFKQAADLVVGVEVFKPQKLS